MVAVYARTVMPRSRSTARVSSTYASLFSNFDTVFVISSIRSAKVDFPWSICAIIEKLRMRSRGIAASKFLSMSTLFLSSVAVLEK